MAEAAPEPAAGRNPAPRALLDACVLYPTVLRDILLGCAEAGLFVPLWSPRILAEWAHAAARLGPPGTAAAAAAIARLRAAHPQAEILPDPATEAALSLPDPADAHVLAAALAGRAELLVTLNLRDFPARALGPHGLYARAPDAFLMDLWLARPAPVEAAVAAVQVDTACHSGRPQRLRALLRRAGLSRLGKALDPDG